MYENYVLSSWVWSCVQGFKYSGWDEQAILKESGIDITYLDKQYCDIELAYKVFSVAERYHGPAIGLATRLGLVPNTFHSLSLAVMSSPTFIDGLRLVCEFSAYITNAVTYCLDDAKEHPAFSYSTLNHSSIHPTLVDSIFTATIRTFRFIQPQSAVIHSVHKASPAPHNQQDYESYYKAPILWSQPEDKIVLDRASASLPSMHFNPSMLTEHKSACLVGLSNLLENRFLNDVKSRMRHMLKNTQPNICSLANMLNLSTRSLQRRLSEHGTNYSELLDEVKKNEAKQLLQASDLSISEIAQLSGFSDSGNFCRAFKRWFDLSPEAYRKLSKV